MAKICLGITTAFFALQLGADPIIVGGTKKQKQKWLGAIAEGNALVAYAVTEPDAGSNVAAIKTKADPVTDDGGDIIGYKINGSKQFISTGAGEFIENLDALPLPSRHLLPLSKYKALGFPISIITSRGCPNKCIFCLGRKMVGFKVRYRDPARVVDEIESILDKGFERINIADDLFTANKKRVKVLCEEILNRKIRFGWSAFARVDTVDEETLAIMKKAGCDAVSFGIESGNPEMLKRVRKRITLDQARAAVAACKKVGMIAHASFMVGLPGENHQTMQDSFDFARELAIEHGYHFLAPFPGTTVREHLEDYDLEILTDDWTRYDANKAIVKTSYLDPDAMETFVAEAYTDIFEQWEASKRNCAEGTGTPEERLAVESEQRLKLIFGILSNDMIQDIGGGHSSAEDPLMELSIRIADKIDMEPDFVYRYIRVWHEKEYLVYSQANGLVKWSWAKH